MGEEVRFSLTKPIYYLHCLVTPFEKVEVLKGARMVYSFRKLFFFFHFIVVVVVVFTGKVDYSGRLGMSVLSQV